MNARNNPGPEIGFSFSWQELNECAKEAEEPSLGVLENYRGVMRGDARTTSIVFRGLDRSRLTCRKAAGTAPGGGRSDAVDPSLTPASIGSGLVDGPIVDVPVDQYARFSTLLCIATSPND